MATYHRLGTHVLAGELASDPFGKVHRGLTLVGSHFDRHKLVRTFSDELQEAGLSARLEETRNASARLTGSRAFLQGYHPEAEKPGFAAFDHVGGRSLAQMIHKARIEQIPLGVDHALSVLQGLAQAVIFLHSHQMTHGILSPSSVWITYEGAALLLDAPYASQIQGLLPRCPVLARSLAPYRPTAPVSPLQLDLFALGAILFELLTFEPLPAPQEIPGALQQATLKAAQEEDPIPAEIQGLLRRMLLVEAPFEKADAFNAELERVLYDGDYSPTTFNMAFFMHTLFREESEHDAAALKADEAADYSPLVTETSAQDLNVDTQKYVRIGLFAGIPIILLLGGLFWSNMSKNKANEELNARLMKMEEENKAAMSKLQDIQTREANLIIEERATQERLKNAKTAEEKKQAEQKLKDLQADKAAAAKEKAQVQQAAQVVQQNLQAIRNNPAQLPPTTQAPPAITNPQPTQTASKPAAQQQAPPPPVLPAGAPPQVGSQPAVVPQPAPAPAPAVNVVSESQPPACIQQAQPNNAAIAAAKVKAKLVRSPQTTLSIRVQVFVDENGRPRQTRIEKDSGTHLGLEEAVTDAAMASSFKPGTKDGKPKAQWFSMEYRVNLK